MVNPDRRATIEEIAGHWWLNWGYLQPLLCERRSSHVEQTSAPVSPSTSQPAGLAGVASWLRRTSRPLLENGSKMRCLLRTQGSAGDVVRQRSLRRSRKENNITQAVHEGSTDTRPSKGILKRRNSVKQKSISETSTVSLVEPQKILDLSAPGKAPSAAQLPRKGILKKPAEQESGYYSSSPENSDSGLVMQTKECPSAPPYRKGILKRNGKFSSGGLHEFGSLDQLATSLPHGGGRSRPSGAISEDSILSSESFDQLDLPDHVRPAMQMDKPAKASMRGCVSADNLLDIQEDRILSDGLLRSWDCYKTGVADSAFSISDCDNVTEAYKQAMVIRSSNASWRPVIRDKMLAKELVVILNFEVTLTILWSWKPKCVVWKYQNTVRWSFWQNSGINTVPKKREKTDCIWDGRFDLTETKIRKCNYAKEMLQSAIWLSSNSLRRRELELWFSLLEVASQLIHNETKSTSETEIQETFLIQLQ